MTQIRRKFRVWPWLAAPLDDPIIIAEIARKQFLKQNHLAFNDHAGVGRDGPLPTNRPPKPKSMLRRATIDLIGCEIRVY
jgi:hypothetical protein